MRLPRSAIAALACCLAAASLLPAQRRKKEEETQTLAVRKDLPNAVAAETRRLTFHTTPLSAKGLLSPQVRDALKALQHETSGETVVKIRAFIAGSADLRHVRDLVSDHFGGRKQPLPALTLVQSGGLPLEGAQIEMEAIATAKKEVNPNGLALISPEIATAGDPLGPVPPLTQKSLAGLRQKLEAIGLEAPDVLRITCFVSSLENIGESRRMVEADYPHAAADYVQTQRAPTRALAACEAVARLRSAPASPLELRNTEGSAAPAGESQIALAGAPQLVFTGNQDSFGFQDADARLAFERLAKTLEQAGASAKTVAYAHYYPLSLSLANQVRKIRASFFDQQHPPAGALLTFEGLASMDAGFAVDVVAVKP